MNKTTLAIKAKGYSLTGFCKKWRISLRTYRRWEKPDNRFHDVLNGWIEETGVKND